LKKKFILLLIALILVSSSAFAAIFQFGPAASLPLPLNFSEREAMGEQFKSIENYKFGADLRLSLPTKWVGVQADLLGLVSFGEGSFRFETMPTVDLVLFSQMPVNITAGIGYDLTWAFGEAVDFADTFKHSPFVYRVGLNIDAKIVGLGISYYMPTTASFANASLENWKPSPETGKLAVSVFLMNF